MDNRIKIGQRLCMGFPRPYIDEQFKRIVHEYKIGNVVLLRRNIQSKTQLKHLCADIQQCITKETGHPAFICITQEGGAVSRLPEDMTDMPGAMALSATGKPENAYTAAKIMAQELSALGVNFNLAPDMDVNSNRHNPVIGVRSFGDTPETVIQYGLAAMNGFRDGGMLCCVKHFPGHGDTDIDSHIGLPLVNKSPLELSQCELAPFYAAVQAGADAVMTSHILFPQLETEKIPATMSRAIMTGLLKEKMNFNGLVVSDDMMMQGIARDYGTIGGTLRAIQAGVDLVFICQSPKQCADTAEEAWNALETGKLNTEENERSYQKILRMKERIMNVPYITEDAIGCAAHHRLADEIMEQSLASYNASLPTLGTHPLFAGCAPFRATAASEIEKNALCFPELMKEHLGGDALVTSENPSEEEIKNALALISGHTCLVVGTYNGHLNKGQLHLVKAFESTNLPTICIALRNPYDLSLIGEKTAGLAAWQYSARSLRAVLRVLKGEITPHGVIPVNL